MPYLCEIQITRGALRVLETCGFRRDRVQEAKAPVPEDGIEELVFVLNA